MPTAVMMESTEKTRSSSRIWKMAPPNVIVHGAADHVLLVVDRVDRVVDLLGRLPDEEQAAGDQDDVPPGEGLAEEREDRRGQLDDEGDRAEQHQAHDQRRADAEPAGALALMLGQLVGEDRDEDQVVDAEHDLQRDEREQRDPGGGIVDQSK